MKRSFHRKELTRELVIILSLALFLSLTYNSFSTKGLPLIRVAPPTQSVPDSALFAQPSVVSPAPTGDTVTSYPEKIKVIAPLHERALRSPDSMKALVHAKPQDAVYKVITLDQLKRLLVAGRGVLIDARSEEDFLKGHIKGSRNVPGQYPENHFAELAQIPRDSLVVIYCNNPECHLGRMLGEFMHVMEFNNIVLYDDGWDGWVHSGMPVDSTTKGMNE